LPRDPRFLAYDLTDRPARIKARPRVVALSFPGKRWNFLLSREMPANRRNIDRPHDKLPHFP
jgi:hypothetical protein